MKPKYRLFQRAGIFYSVTTDHPRKQVSLGTKDRRTAERLLHAKNEAHHQPLVTLQIARAYLTASDPQIAKRKWNDVMHAMVEQRTGKNRERWERAVHDLAFDVIRDLLLLETRPEHFLRTLQMGTVSTNVYLRRIHNFALDMTWLPWPIINKRQWPKIVYEEKRAITEEEHVKIVAREPNADRKAFYELCWHLGDSQADIANLRGEDADWNDRTIAYRRKKTKTPALIHFGDLVEAILQALPRQALFFPKLAPMESSHRATEFKRACRRAGVVGVTLHSYRYAWAEKGRTVGMPERFAQEVLGHASKAVHRAYAKKAKVKVPSLEEYAKRHGNATVVAVEFAASPKSFADSH